MNSIGCNLSGFTFIGAILLIHSAATSTEEIGSSIHHGTLGIFKEKGIPCTGHKAVQMTKKDYAKYDYLIGMDDANIRNMQRIAGQDGEKKIYKLLDFTDKSRAIADPWYTGDFETTYEDVSEGCEALYKHLL